MAFIMFQRGATSWGFQIGRVYVYVPYLRYGGARRIKIGYERE